jgi:peptidoglycan glycosyltransferase
MFASSGGVRWLQPVQRRRRRRVPFGPLLALLALLVLAAGAFAFVRSRDDADDPSQAVAQRFAAAWAKGHLDAAYALTTAKTQDAQSARLFRQSYRQSARAATVRKVEAGPAGEPQDGAVPVPVTVRTRTFGPLKGTIRFPVERTGDTARVAWTPDLRLPGLRPDERVHRRLLRQPPRASVLDADGRRLARTSSAGGLAASLDDDFDARLSGRPGAELRYGKRVVAKVKIKRGRSVKTTIRPSMQAAAVSALGDRVGGIAVIQPRTGNVLGIAGLALNGPQPPGSSFKIITLAAALNEGKTEPSETFPVRTQATLSGVPLRNAGDESCGGSLTTSFAHSCNSVFGPLGVRLGAKRLVRYAEAFGFNEKPPIPGAKRSSIPHDLKDDLAVGASAIGQDRDLATALTMASVGATIADRGVRHRPRLLRSDKRSRARVVKRSVASEVRDMMLEVVRSGTGVSAALPGAEIAGKTGTAELVPTADAGSDPSNTDAWFVAFDAADPKIAVAVMLVGAGQGGASAAPLAREVIAASL